MLLFQENVLPRHVSARIPLAFRCNQSAPQRSTAKKLLLQANINKSNSSSYPHLFPKKATLSTVSRQGTRINRFSLPLAFFFVIKFGSAGGKRERPVTRLDGQRASGFVFIKSPPSHSRLRHQNAIESAERSDGRGYDRVNTDNGTPS